MNFSEAISNMNFLAVVIAAVAGMAIGAIWYSPVLFSNAWMKENGVTKESLKGKNPFAPMIFSFLITIVMAFNLAMFLSGESDFVQGLIAGGLVGIGWVAASLAVLYLFESKSLKLFLINAGYNVVTFIVMGGIIGVWK